MSEPSPAMNVGTESASPSATEAVLSCIAALEAEGFARPRSLSADAYLAALAELHPVCAPDLAFLAACYAERRFGGGRNAVELSSVIAACARVVELAAQWSESREIALLRDVWRTRFSMPNEPADVTVIPAEVAFVDGEATDSSADGAMNSSPRPGADARPEAGRSALRTFDPSRFLSGTSVSLRSAAGALVLSGALASLGAFCFPGALERIRNASGESSSGGAFALADAPIVLVAPAPVSIGLSELADPAWPSLFPATHPQADQFNEVIAGALSDLAELYRGIGRPERAAAIYSYVADARPDDVCAQIEYADYLLNPENPEHRDPDRACVHAERAFALNPSDRRAVETLTAALYATGEVARAVEIQQEWLDRERQAVIVLNREDGPSTDRSAG